MNEVLNLIIPNILEIIITIISLVVSYHIIPYVRKDLIPMLKEKHLYDTVKKFVQASEKLAESGVIERVDKKAKVVELLENKGIDVDETTEAFIESAVKELDNVTSVVYEEIIEVDDEEE
jgi:microcompartment protein CcmL/EutN